MDFGIGKDRFGPKHKHKKPLSTYIAQVFSLVSKETRKVPLEKRSIFNIVGSISINTRLYYKVEALRWHLRGFHKFTNQKGDEDPGKLERNISWESLHALRNVVCPVYPSDTGKEATKQRTWGLTHLASQAEKKH